MSDRRFAEQGDNLKDRARWEAGSPDDADPFAPGAEAEDAAGNYPEQDSGIPESSSSAGQDLPEYLPEDSDGTGETPDAPVVAEAPTAAAPGPVPVRTTDADAGANAGADAEAGANAVPDSADSATARSAVHFLPDSAADKLRDRWQRIQIDFVDDPRHSVEEADALLEQVAEQFTEALTTTRGSLRDGWNSAGPGSAADDSGTSTEQLRGSIREYRELLNRLLDT
jgi:hypothetical protein